MTDFPLTLGISPCPNDTFIFEEWITGRVAEVPSPAQVRFEDVQTLNELVLQAALPLAKISCGTWPLVQQHYELLPCGGAMGYGCGPLLLSHTLSDPDSEEIWLPGPQTTATLLFRYWAARQKRMYQERYARFDLLYHNLCQRSIHQAVVIHEHRFTWQQDGLLLQQDLGAFWEQMTGSPIPLGVIVLHRDYHHWRDLVIRAIQQSLQQAWNRPDQVTPFIRKHAQIDSDEVIRSHIETFVNDFSLNMSDAGVRALKTLEQVLQEQSS